MIDDLIGTPWHGLILLAILGATVGIVRGEIVLRRLMRDDEMTRLEAARDITGRIG